MLNRIRRHARMLIAAGLLFGSLAVATPVLALEDCNRYENAFERMVCFVQVQVEIMLTYFD